eukprot:5253318-Amphidinium_carterae.1
MAAVTQHGRALQYAAEECKAESAIVLAAVKQNGMALQYAAEECKADREIVLAAVKQNWFVLQLAVEECKADHQIVLAAVQQSGMALGLAADELLLDSTFAPEAKQDWHILKVSMLSSRSTVVMADGDFNADVIVGRCCSRLQIQKTGTTALVHGTEVVPTTAQVSRT